MFKGGDHDIDNLMSYVPVVIQSSLPKKVVGGVGGYKSPQLTNGTAGLGLRVRSRSFKRVYRMEQKDSCHDRGQYLR